MPRRNTWMLSSDEIVDKLYLTAERFMDAVKAQDWYRAKFCYDTAVRVAVFCEVPNTVREEIFGVHGDVESDVHDGLFKDEYVLLAYEKCIIAGKTYDIEPPMRVPIKKS